MANGPIAGDYFRFNWENKTTFYFFYIILVFKYSKSCWIDSIAFVPGITFVSPVKDETSQIFQVLLYLW